MPKRAMYPFVSFGEKKFWDDCFAISKISCIFTAATRLRCYSTMRMQHWPSALCIMQTEAYDCLDANTKAEIVDKKGELCGLLMAV